MPTLKELGYTDSDFGPNRTYITERAAETAIAASIVQIRAIRPEIERVRDFINERVKNPDYQFPAEIDELSFVFRWGGKGNISKWKIPFLGERGWDTKLETADPDTRYLNAWDISQPALDQLRLGEAPAGSATVNEMNPYTSIDITVTDWENPKLTQRLIRGVLFNRAKMRGRDTAGNVASDLTDAFSADGLRRNQIFDEAAFLNEQAFDDLMPIAAILRAN